MLWVKPILRARTPIRHGEFAWDGMCALPWIRMRERWRLAPQEGMARMASVGREHRAGRKLALICSFSAAVCYGAASAAFLV